MMRSFCLFCLSVDDCRCAKLKIITHLRRLNAKPKLSIRSALGTLFLAGGVLGGQKPVKR